MNLSAVVRFLEHVQDTDPPRGRSGEQALVAGSDINREDCSFPSSMLSPEIQSLAQTTPRGTAGMFITVKQVQDDQGKNLSR